MSASERVSFASEPQAAVPVCATDLYRHLAVDGKLARRWLALALSWGLIGAIRRIPAVARVI